MEYIPIAQPNASTLAKLSELTPSTTVGDRKQRSTTTGLVLMSRLAIDAVIVGIETQAEYLSSKKTWTRKMVLVTDAESPIELEDWEAIVNKMNENGVSLAIMSVPSPDS